MATRVPLQVVNGEGEEEVRTPLYKVLRSGKRIIATTLKKASRVAASPRAVKGAQAARVLSPEVLGILWDLSTSLCGRARDREPAEQSPVVPQQDEERSTAPDSDELGTACKATAEDVLEEPADDAPSATEGVGITVEVKPYTIMPIFLMPELCMHATQQSLADCPSGRQPGPG